jgi:predicted TIM-barrel fold metal-dependent hydrolase
VLFPGQVAGPRLWRAIGDDDIYRSVVRAYNDFVGEEYCPVDPDRLIGLGVIPWTNLNDAIDELEHCKQLGLKGVVIGRFPNGRGYPKPEDDEFWKAALDMQMPITVHVEMDRSAERDGKLIDYPKSHPEIGPGRGLLDQLTNAKFCRLGGVNAIQMVFSGIFDRFPNLKVFYAENQIGWIPFFFEMADERYERHAGWAQEMLGVAPLERAPSEYLKEHCLWGFQHDLVGIQLREHLGVDHVMWASDFPHQESDWPDSLKVIDKNFASVTAEEKDRMVARNAVEFFHLN